MDLTLNWASPEWEPGMRTDPHSNDEDEDEDGKAEHCLHVTDQTDRSTTTIA